MPRPEHGTPPAASDPHPRPSSHGAALMAAEDDAVLSSFAHDVRSISAAAEGLAFRAGSRTEDPRAKAYLEAIRESMTRLASMASSALELARSGGQSIRLADETVDVAAIARSAAATMEEAFEEAGASCLLSLGDASVHGDSTALYRIVLNVLTNALLHGTSRTASRVELVVQQVADRVLVQVSDEGAGFPRALLGAFPVPSWQAGRGLGLSIVARLTHQHGGIVRLENRATRGAVVSIELPAAVRGSAVP